jgi:UDP-N-acetylglucosamine diphosphorylase/glucosamine-1-phosphate N-acetyltransferase
MNLILFDDPLIRLNLLPFTFTRPTAKIRVGILTIAEKWEKRLNVTSNYKTEGYLQPKFPLQSTEENLLVNGAVCPDQKLIDTIKALPAGYFLVKDSLLIAANRPSKEMTNSNTVQYSDPLTVIDKTWKIFMENGQQIRADYALITENRSSQKIQDKHTIIYGESNVFIEEGVSIRAAIINAENGPVYIGRNAIVEEGSIIRGPFALCEGANLNMGSKMRGDVTIGPFSKVGGEVSTSVIFGYSNKGHDGFLGSSVLGEWCNLGAGTNNSNLKNNYEPVKLWNHAAGRFENTGLQFCGLMMGDHSKSGINTMFNTGTVVDVGANVFGDGFPRNFIPSFSWGGGAGFTTYRLDKMLETARKVMERRNIKLQEVDQQILYHVFQMTTSMRTTDN